MYANVHPNTVRSMVLHGVEDAAYRFNDVPGCMSTEARTSNQVTQAVLAGCDAVGKKRCAFAGGAKAKYQRLVNHYGPNDRTSKDNWADLVGFGRDLGGSYDRATAQKAAAGLQKLYAKTFPSGRDAAPTAKAPAPSAYTETDVGHATQCSDMPAVPRTAAGWWPLLRDARKQSLVDGSALTDGCLPCAGLRIRSPLPRYTGPWNRGNANIVLLNETQDHSASLDWARHMNRALGARSRLVPIDGFGHAVPTACSRKVAAQHFLTTLLPAGGTRCTDGVHNPFTAKQPGRPAPPCTAPRLPAQRSAGRRSPHPNGPQRVAVPPGPPQARRACPWQQRPDACGRDPRRTSWPTKRRAAPRAPRTRDPETAPGPPAAPSSPGYCS
ncbi:alpha/beta hydrolase [Streptomyces monticola]|uniref:Alpha/beta hydrolase n=1 Tax=Streptomyces monticola TaxID=2666263 RepID=A0ABW2JFB3_9ACTN